MPSRGNYSCSRVQNSSCPLHLQLGPLSRRDKHRILSKVRRTSSCAPLQPPSSGDRRATGMSVALSVPSANQGMPASGAQTRGGASPSGGPIDLCCTWHLFHSAADIDREPTPRYRHSNHQGKLGTGLKSLAGNYQAILAKVLQLRGQEAKPLSHRLPLLLRFGGRWQSSRWRGSTCRHFVSDAKDCRSLLDWRFLIQGIGKSKFIHGLPSPQPM